MQISQSSLESKGVIKRCPSGLFYIQVEKKPGQELSDIENSLIETLSEFSKIESYSANPIIPIILPKEAMQSENLGIKNIIGQTVRFTISKLSATRQVNDAQETAHMFLEVDSQELIDLREKFLLPSRISSHNFHILLCCMKKETTPTKSLFRLNISCHAA
ncbi:MAG: hypothetical protein FJZ57_01255 [Chlamydiae bacterium]|nr:hypothetical protein [Chlamydiota bacterium]